MTNLVDLNQVSEVLKTLVPKKGKNITAVARRLGISSQLLGQYMSGRQSPKTAFYLKWKEVFGEDLLTRIETNVSNEASQVQGMPQILPLGDLKVTLKDYVNLLAETARKAEERERELLLLLKENIIAIKTNSETILADLQDASRMIRADDLSMMRGTDKTLGREDGATAKEAHTLERALGESDEESGKSDKKSSQSKISTPKQRYK